MLWLLEKGLAHRIESAREAAGGAHLTAEQLGTLQAARDSRKLSVEGRTAVVPVVGTLTKTLDWFAMYFGGGNTLYGDIIADIAQANADGSVDNIELRVNSPGGAVEGIYEAMAAVRDSEKPVTALTGHLAASAAYMLASQAQSIQAESELSTVGSIGVATAIGVFDFVVDITNTKSPNKRPDVTTDEGKAVVQEYLDSVHDVLVEKVAEGRGTTVAKVNKNFGKGSLLIASEAEARGMIDGIAVAPKEEPSATGGQTLVAKEAITMDMNQLKAEHPGLYEAAVANGVKQERDRVCAHLTFGEKAGAMDTAVKAIEDGEEMTQTIQAQYMTAALDKRDAGNRGDDNPDHIEPDAATPAGKTPEPVAEDKHMDELSAELTQLTGVALD